MPNPELVLTHLDSLPTLAPIAIQLLHVTSDADSSVDDVVGVLRADQSLTAKVLAVANSAALGAGGSVTTLERAVSLLGFSAIRSIVLAVKIFDCFPPGDVDKSSVAIARSFQRSEFWKHALAVACGARRLAQTRRDLGLNAEDAFVAGLLHDLGKVALDAVFPKAYERIAQQSDQVRGDIADWERSILGVDHTVAGRRLAESWRLPAYLHEVIWLHHLAAEALPSSVTSRSMIALVQLADAVAREQRLGYSGNHLFYEPSAEMARRIGLTADDVGGALQPLAADVSEHAAVLGLGREAPDRLYHKALTEANAELGRLNAELADNNRRLAAGARFFKAVTEFDRRLGARSDGAEVVSAIARASVTALQRPNLAAFGVRENGQAVDVCWVCGSEGTASSTTRTPAAETAAWLRSPGECLDVCVARAPQAVRTLVSVAVEYLGAGDPWLLPIVHDGRVVGGIVFLSEADERTRLAPEIDDLRSYLASLGLALGRANAQAAARRLSDDLADTNRRLQQMQLEVLRSRTLSMIAEMAAGAAHELNNPLTVISGRAQMLHQQSEQPEMQESLEIIREKAHECSRIVSELMDFAHPPTPRVEMVDLAALLREVRTEWLTESELPASQLVLVSDDGGGGPAAPSIEADREQIKTVIRELVSNATDAVSGTDGRIAISWRAGLTDEVIELLFEDSGCGMNPAVLQRVFDPFFSHRQAGRGRGLGLPRAQRIVEAHEGRIWFESRPGEGTTAHVILPKGHGAGT